MNTQEATKLLALIKVAYPNSYKGMDDDSLMATVNMWHRSFADIPYRVMEMAFDRLRMTLKFPPTVADFAEQLRSLHYEADQIAGICRSIGDTRRLSVWTDISRATYAFRDWPNANNCYGFDFLEIGGSNNAGTSGNRLGGADGLPFLETGTG